MWCRSSSTVGYRLLLSRPLLYRCLMGMEDTKPQRRSLTTQEHNNIRNNQLLYRGPPVLHGSTPLRHRSITPQPTLLQPTTPRLPSTTPPENSSTTRLRMLLQLTTPRRPSITLLQLTTPRSWILLYTQLHTHNWGGRVLCSTYLLHSGFSIVLPWSELLLRGSS
jgi:hypothetical protein